jgi:hypothetical protein
VKTPAKTVHGGSPGQRSFPGAVDHPTVNALCFDIDDLAYNLDIPAGKRGSHRYLVEKETYRLLEFLESFRITSTMFIPGHVAERFPSLVKSIADAGHEIAAHGYSHRRSDLLHRKGFREDARKSKATLEHILSLPIFTYKAPNWNITPGTSWAYDELIDLGYAIDHTARPQLLSYLGRDPGDMAPFLYEGCLAVIPVTTLPLFQHSVCFNGGLFCAYAPVSIQIAYYRRLNRKGMPFNYFCHPYESHPEGTNSSIVKHRSLRASLYGMYFGKYRGYIARLASQFVLGPLRLAYRGFLGELLKPSCSLPVLSNRYSS